MSSSWSDLPQELLTLILIRLPLPDRLRFSSVCSSWRLSASISVPFSPQPPWLLLPHNPTLCPKSASRFFNLSENKTYKIERNEGSVSVSDCLCVGSSNGWLIVADCLSELHLINPISGFQIDLPSVTSFPFVDVTRDNEGRVSGYVVQICEELPRETFLPDKLRYFLYEKAILAPKFKKFPSNHTWSPLLDDFTVVLLYNALFGLAYVKKGVEKWNLIETLDSYWVDLICSCDGQIYSLESKGRVDSWNFESEIPALKSIAPKLGYYDCAKYVVELSPYHLLQIHRWKDTAHTKYTWESRHEYVEYTTKKVMIFEWIRGMKKWVENKDGLKDFALFLGRNASLRVNLRDCPELRRNCVYFTDDSIWSYEKCHEVFPDVGIFDLVVKNYESCCASDLVWKWPPPIWISPTLN